MEKVQSKFDYYLLLLIDRGFRNHHFKVSLKLSRHLNFIWQFEEVHYKLKPLVTMGQPEILLVEHYLRSMDLIRRSMELLLDYPYTEQLAVKVYHIFLILMPRYQQIVQGYVFVISGVPSGPQLYRTSCREEVVTGFIR